MTTPKATHGFIDPRALMRIKSLQMRARVVVEGFYRGLHRSPYHGFSVEFSEYRDYTPGDDPRYLDWRLYARSDRYCIKRFEDETNLRCHLVVDASRSMGDASESISKWEYARTAAATIAYFLTRQRDAVGLATFEDRVVDYLPPRHRPGHLHRLMAILQREPLGKATNFAGPLEEIVCTVHRRSLFVLLSDLLVPAVTVRTTLGNLRAVGHDVIVLRVLDPAEEAFPFATPALFHDAESGRELFIDPQREAEPYRQRFAAHGAEVQRACADLGVEFVQLNTDRPLELVLFDLLKARMQRGRQPGRRAAPGRGGAR
ncbi:DUF58 domain-containing protein [soil metagenome]